MLDARYAYFKTAGIAAPKRSLVKAIDAVNNGALDNCFGKNKSGFSSEEVTGKLFFYFFFYYLNEFSSTA